MINLSRAWVLLWTPLLALTLAGCAVAPRELASADGLSGRLLVKVDATQREAAKSLSAAFELQGNADTGRLDLVSPLGSVLARARWSPEQVVLVTPQGETRFPDLDALTREVLGEPLPIVALFDWLRGRPWAGAASAATSPPADAGFEQLGWTVSLARFDEAWIAARREHAPAVSLRAKIDRP